MEKNAKKMRFGNYRKPETWSKRTKDFFGVLRKVTLESVPKKTPGFKILSGVLGYYPDGFRSMLEKMAIELVNDIYRLDIQTPMVQTFAYSDENLKEVSSDISYLFSRFGELGILFSDGEPLPERLVIEAMKVDDEVYLTKRKVGLPVDMFLLLYKGGDEKLKVIIHELSGIRPTKQPLVYSALIEAFRDEILVDRFYEKKYRNR